MSFVRDTYSIKGHKPEFWHDVLSPFDGTKISRVALLSEAQALASLAQLNKTFRESRMPKNHERIAILKKAAYLIESRAESFADLIAFEGGKPLKDARVEVARAVNSIELAADEALRLAGREVPMRGTKAAMGHIAFTYPEPIGVVYAISAFNHPLNLIAHQVAPAIAVGCPVLVKPAIETPLSCLHLLDTLYEAGLPVDMAQPLLCTTDVAEKIARSQNIAFLSFIGSSKVGWHLRSVLAPGTRVSLEHGGSAPVIIDESADLSKLIPTLVRAAFYHSGQVCVSAQRIFIHRSIRGQFTELFLKAVGELKTGDPRKEETDCGPIIRKKDLERIDSWVQEAVGSGAMLLAGGRKLSDSLYAPTVLTDVPLKEKIIVEEVFGPVVSLISVDSLDQAIEFANAVPWRFQASIFTRDLESAMQAGRRLQASSVMINEGPAFRVDWMPFRGDKASGYGTGGIEFTMRDMTIEKMLVIKSPSFEL